jgi:L-aminoadipate-semialdehyde dehydrogenase
MAELMIEPTYPPTRQIIYPEVGSPAGLIVIQAVGTLPDLVRQHILEKLPLKAYLADFNIHDLLESGGNSFPQGVPLTSSHAPKVVVGPDSIPSLCFTSGSEGKPKGVYGRHFSLTGLARGPVNGNNGLKHIDEST